MYSSLNINLDKLLLSNSVCPLIWSRLQTSALPSLLLSSILNCLGSKDKSVPRDALTLLSRVISNLAKYADCFTSSSNQGTKVHTPDQFDGSDFRKLCTFLVQCKLNFQNCPRAFHSDRAKVTFAQSYLKGMALGWFKPNLLLADNSDLSFNPSSDSSELRPLWMENYQEFILKLQTYFGPHDPVGDAEHQLHHLSFKDGQHIYKYMVEFNHLACQLQGYGDGALQHLFYSKLLDCIKDKISCIGKPHTMPDLRVLAQSIDVRYWEHKSELNCQIFVTGHTTSIISAPTSSSMMPSNSKPTSDSKSISNSISDSGHLDPSSDLPDPHSFISDNSEDSDSEAAEPAFKLGDRIQPWTTQWFWWFRVSCCRALYSSRLVTQVSEAF